jgi:hypothetical protein
VPTVGFVGTRSNASVSCFPVGMRSCACARALLNISWARPGMDGWGVTGQATGESCCASAAAAASAMGMLFKAYLSGTKIWSCERCAAHLASHDDIISKVRLRGACGQRASE